MFIHLRYGLSSIIYVCVCVCVFISIAYNVMSLGRRMENICFDVSSECKPGPTYEWRTPDWFSILCISGFAKKQKCWRLCLVCILHGSSHGSFELARNTL